MLKIGSPVPHRKSRIEIIPLIDIMFFLLAAFMMVSLQLSRTDNIAVQLPKALAAQADFSPGSVNVAVDRGGTVFFERRSIGEIELSNVLSNRFRIDPNLVVTISGDLAAEHGDMVRVYRWVRRVGIQRVSFCVTPGASTPLAGPSP